MADRRRRFSRVVPGAIVLAAAPFLAGGVAGQSSWTQDVGTTGLSCVSCHTGTDGGPLTEVGRRLRWSGGFAGVEHALAMRSQDDPESESAPSVESASAPDLGDWSGRFSWFGRAGRTRVLGATERQVTSTEILELQGSRLLGRDNLSFQGEAIARSSLASGTEGFDDDAVQLVSAPLEWLGATPGSYLRIGRQFIASGVAVQWLDGAAVRQPLGDTFEIEAFGGIPSDRGLEGRSGDLLMGGRLGARLGASTHAGLSTYYAKDSSDPADLKVGLDFDTAPFRQLQISAHLFYDGIGDRLYDARVHAVYLPSIEWQLAGDYSRTVPGLFLPKNSIFSVFSVDDYEETALTLTRRLDAHRSVRAFGRYTAYRGGEDLIHVGAGLDLRFGPNGEDSFGVEAAYQDEERSSLGGSSADGDTLFLRAYHFLYWSARLYTAVDLSVQAYAGDPLERNALLGEIAVGLRPTDRLDLQVGVDYVRDAEFEDRLDLFSRVVFHF